MEAWMYWIEYEAMKQETNCAYQSNPTTICHISYVYQNPSIIHQQGGLSYTTREALTINNDDFSVCMTSDAMSFAVTKVRVLLYPHAPTSPPSLFLPCDHLSPLHKPTNKQTQVQKALGGNISLSQHVPKGMVYLIPSPRVSYRVGGLTTAWDFSSRLASGSLSQDVSIYNKAVLMIY